MRCQPGDDTDVWAATLAHRPPDVLDTVRDRFVANDVPPDLVRAALDDGGDALHAAVTSGATDWADKFGGPLPAALIAAEVSALAAHLNSRASAVRSLAVRELLDDYSAITVAAHLAVSRQKVYEIGRAGTNGTYIDRVPWRGQP
jgi:hypothetical protein